MHKDTQTAIGQPAPKPTESKSNHTCPVCGAPTFFPVEGCHTCMTCGYSLCSR